jgi:hypothetical protein
MPRVLKYHTGVWRMTYNPAGPRTPKYIAVYICSLFEAAYWAQQAIVMLLGMEKPRKDFMELVTHHVPMREEFVHATRVEVPHRRLAHDIQPRGTEDSKVLPRSMAKVCGT